VWYFRLANQGVKAREREIVCMQNKAWQGGTQRQARKGRTNQVEVLDEKDA
jgi:hypothetical protein